MSEKEFQNRIWPNENLRFSFRTDAVNENGIKLCPLKLEFWPLQIVARLAQCHSVPHELKTDQCKSWIDHEVVIVTGHGISYVVCRLPYKLTYC